MPPEQRVQGALQPWAARQKLRGYQPTEAEIAAGVAIVTRVPHAEA